MHIAFEPNRLRNIYVLNFYQISGAYVVSGMCSALIFFKFKFNFDHSQTYFGRTFCYDEDRREAL